MSMANDDAKVWDHEDWYDNEIAPLLADIGRKCVEKGVPFVAVVKYRNGEEEARGQTRYVPEGAKGEHLDMVAVSHAAKMGRNIDGFMMGLRRHCIDRDIDMSRSLYLTAFAGE